MATLARYSGTRQLPGVRRPQVIADTAVGEATAALGRQIQQSAAQVGELARARSEAEERHQKKIQAAHQYQIDHFEGTKRLVAFNASVPQIEAEARKNTKPGGAGYVAGVAEAYDNEAKQVIANTPPSARPIIQRGLVAQRPQVIARAEKSERLQRVQHYRDGVAEVAATTGASITADPATYDAAFGVCAQAISESGLAPTEKEVLLGSVKREMQLKFAEGQPAKERAKYSAVVEDANGNSEDQPDQGLAPDILERTDALTPKDMAEIGKKGQRDLISAAADKQDRYAQQIDTNLQDVDPDQIRNDPDLNETQKDRVLQRHAAAMEERDKEIDAVALVSTKGRLNPVDPEARGQVDRAWKVIGPNSPNPEASLAELVRNKGVIPELAIKEIEAGLEGRDWQQVLAAYGRASMLVDLDEVALTGSGYAETLKEAKSKWQFYTVKSGFSPEKAAQRLAAANDTDIAQKWEVLLQSRPVQTRLKYIDALYVERSFDPGIFSRGPKLGRTAAERAIAVDEYKKMFQDAIIEMGGDLNAAEDLAQERFKRTWAPSRFSTFGDGVVANFPVETFYPKLSKEGGYDYVAREAEKILSEEGVDYQSYAIVFNEDTFDDWRKGPIDERGFGPRMTLKYKGKDNKWHTLQGSFYVDIFGAASEEYEKREQALAEREAEFMAESERLKNLPSRYERKHHPPKAKTADGVYEAASGAVVQGAEKAVDAIRDVLPDRPTGGDPRSKRAGRGRGKR